MEMGIEEQSFAMSRRADKRFFCNRHLVEDFMRPELYPWIVPLMTGYVEV